MKFSEPIAKPIVAFKIVKFSKVKTKPEAKREACFKS